MREAILKAWYQPRLTPVLFILYPFALFFSAIVFLRRYAYQRGWLQSIKLPVPVIVVGNIVVGGTGKTPTVIALVHYLKACGYRVGVVSRGIGASHLKTPLLVTSTTSTQQAGDEAVLIAKRTELPVVVFPDRVAAAHYLIESKQCNLIIADDGLQHYRLMPTFTIALSDAKRGYGNECLLPAGPLREPVSRLSFFDAVLTTSREAGDILIQPEAWYSVTHDIKHPLNYFSEKPAHVLAGIAHPASFFELTKTLGIWGRYHAFPDHYAYTLKNFDFQPKLPVLMTEKDAVKCGVFGLEDQWYLAESATLPESLKKALLFKLKGVSP